MSKRPNWGVGWPLLTAAASAVAVAGMAAGHWLADGRTVGWDVAWTAAALAALAGILEARRCASPDQRAQWTWWAAAAGSWLIGQLAWDVFSATGSPASPNAADFAWWAFAVLIVIGLLRIPSRSRSLGWVRLADTVLLIASAMALTSAALWLDAHDATLPYAARVSALAYPALYVSAAVITLQALVAGPLRHAQGAGVRLVLGGIIAQAVAFTLWCPQLLDGTYTQGASPLDPIWVIGLIAIGFGGVLAQSTAGEPASEEDSGEVGVLLPATMFFLLAATLLWAEIASWPQGASLMLTAGLFTCGITLIGRGILLNARLRGLLVLERRARLSLSQREGELERLTDRLVADSRHDPLTGLRNRRALAEELAAFERAARRREGSYAVALCDVDHFKAYNDELGHLAGDDALRTLADAAREQLRAGDVAYRYGGEELLIVLADATVEDAEAVAERIREAVEAAAIPHPEGIDGLLTVSIGVAAGVEPATTLLARADVALYAAKREGRNRVRIADSDAVGAQLPPAPVLDTNVEEPILRQLRSVTAVSRAASAEEGALPVLEALARTIRSEFGFTTVCVNLRDFDTDMLEVVVVIGPEDAQRALLGTSSHWSTWVEALDPQFDRSGAAWLPVGTYEWNPHVPSYVPELTTAGARDAWDPEDALLLPLRDSRGDVLAIVAVDEPRSGHRPDDREVQLLMAVADHAAAVIEQIRTDRDAIDSLIDRPDKERLEAVLLLAETLDLRDTGTAEHSRTVGAYARATAEALGLDSRRVERIHKAGILHDLGKLAVPDAILHKPEALDEAEWREIRRHPETGARILSHAGLGDIAQWVHCHHERVDGAGYPRRLADEQIPLEAKILAVADAYEAMISDRPYRRGMDPRDARLELLSNSGSQFDARVVDALLSTLEGNGAGPIGSGSKRPRSAARRARGAGAATRAHRPKRFQRT